MNEAEIRLAIAKFCGENVRLCPVHHSYECCGVRLPDYLNDLNAMAKAESLIEHRMDYCQMLGKVTVGFEHLQWPCVFATAAQRAEALLRCIGKWQDATEGKEKV